MICSLHKSKSNCCSVEKTSGLVVLPVIQQEKPMNWNSSGVTRTRIRVVRVNFSEIFIKGKEIYFELARNSSSSKPSNTE